jgi:hypothetical protein
MGVKTEWLGELMVATPEDWRARLRKRPEQQGLKKTAGGSEFELMRKTDLREGSFNSLI